MYQDFFHLCIGKPLSGKLRRDYTRPLPCVGGDVWRIPAEQTLSRDQEQTAHTPNKDTL